MPPIFEAAELAAKSVALVKDEGLSLKLAEEFGAPSIVQKASSIGHVTAAEHSAPSIDQLSSQIATHSDPALDVVPGNPEERAWVKSLIDGETNLDLVGKMKRGTHGAWLARSSDGANHIFKFVSNDDIRAQLELSAESSARVNSLAARTPQYEAIGYAQGKGSWYLQEFLYGTPAPAPTDKLIGSMLQLNDIAAGKAVGSGRNWSASIFHALYDDSKGWKQRIASSGAEGRSFVSDVQRLIEPNRNVTASAGDVVHGDFQHYNALVHNDGRLSGYIDWDGAGRGDRGIDLSRLLYDSYVSEAEIGYPANPETLKMMSDRVASTSGKALRDNYMGYWSLQVADYGLRKSPADGAMFLGVGRRILSELK